MAQTWEIHPKHLPRHRAHARYVLACGHEEMSFTAQTPQWHACAICDGANFSKLGSTCMASDAFCCIQPEDEPVAVAQESTAPSNGHMAPSSSAAPRTPGPPPVRSLPLPLLRCWDGVCWLKSVTGAAPCKRAFGFLAHRCAAWGHHDRMHMPLSPKKCMRYRGACLRPRSLHFKSSTAFGQAWAWSW